MSARTRAWHTAAARLNGYLKRVDPSIAALDVELAFYLDMRLDADYCDWFPAVRRAYDKDDNPVQIPIPAVERVAGLAWDLVEAHNYGKATNGVYRVRISPAVTVSALSEAS